LIRHISPLPARLDADRADESLFGGMGQGARRRKPGHAPS